MSDYTKLHAAPLPPLLTVPLPPLAELTANTHVVRLPLNTKFRGIRHREAMLLHTPNGWTEFAPFVEYAPAEAATWLAAAINQGWGTPPAPVRTEVAVNATVPAVAATQVADVLARFPGCTTAKVKVAQPGQTLADDIARVRQVRSCMGDNAHIRIDANGAWSTAAAFTALQALQEFNLEYAEQPCATVAELAQLRQQLAGRNIHIRIAADESVRKAADPFAVAAAGAADLLVLKVAPLGGAHRALAIAQQTGLPVVVSSALDTSVGLAAGVALAASLPESLLAGACGLGTAALLAQDVTREPLLPVAGKLSVRTVVADPQLLTEFAAPPARTHWWLQRLAECYRYLR